MFYVGRWNVPTTFDGSVTTGTWAKVNQQTAVGFDFSDYMQYQGNGQTLMTRVCLAYSDTGTTGVVKARLRRTDGASSDGFAAGYVFWSEDFGASYSNAGLIHHECGQWIPVQSLSCGYSWGNTCQFDVSHSQTNIFITMKELDLEMALLSTLR